MKNIITKFKKFLESMRYPDIVTLKTKLNGVDGMCLAEKYGDGSFLFLERLYGKLTETEVMTLLSDYEEEILQVIDDNGRSFEEFKEKYYGEEV